LAHFCQSGGASFKALLHTVNIAVDNFLAVHEMVNQSHLQNIVQGHAREATQLLL
jgi:hypothetical protein